MSQPPPKSPTPSKSSLRRTSSIQNPSQRSLVPSPSPRFDENPTAPIRYSPRSPPNQTLDYESEDDEDALIRTDVVTGAEDGSLFPAETYNDTPDPPRLLQPFFTLIEDSLTSEHHHPSFHYIFADDDTDLITEAALRSLEQEELTASSPTSKTYGQDEARNEEGSIREHEPYRRLPPPDPAVREHFLVLDVHPTSMAQQTNPASQSLTPTQPIPTTISPFNYTVKGFASLSPDWQITSATITSAPTLGDNPDDESLMLRIEGRGFAGPDDTDPTDRTRRPSTAAGQAPDERDPIARGKDKESLEDMIERFQTRLSEIKKLIEVDQNTLAFGEAGTGIGLDIAVSRPADDGPDFVPASYGLGVGIGPDTETTPEPIEGSAGREAHASEEQD